jgi:hypothetical protein
MNDLILSWNKCEGNVWCPFLTVNLQHPHFQNLDGIYIIWHAGQTPWTVYVGQGNIAQRIATHRLDSRILQFSASGLFVTWSKVDARLRDGVEHYLVEQLRPKVGERSPQVPAIPVKLPW